MFFLLIVLQSSCATSLSHHSSLTKKIINIILVIIHGGDGCYCFIIINVKIFFFHYLEQLETSMVGPSQFLPPHRGAGLSQDLERHKQELTPSTPSSLLQGCHGAQDPKPPLVVWFRSWKASSVT